VLTVDLDRIAIDTQMSVGSLGSALAGAAMSSNARSVALIFILDSHMTW
jgi:hypothetical protein